MRIEPKQVDHFFLVVGSSSYIQIHTIELSAKHSVFVSGKRIWHKPHKIFNQPGGDNHVS